MVIVYDPVFNFLPQQNIRYAGTTPVSTNLMLYGNATNVVFNGSVTQTNIAFGLLTRQIRAYGSPDAATNDLCLTMVRDSPPTPFNTPALAIPMWSINFSTMNATN